MSNLSMFLTYLFGITNTVVNITLTLGFIVIVMFIAITELIKKFNPEIDTTEQAINHLISKTKEYDEEHTEEEDDPIFDAHSPYLVFVIYPIFGVFIIIALLLPLFPTYTAGVLDIVIKYYISVLPYFAIVIALYGIGLMFSRLLLWGARKTIDLATSTMKIIKEKKEHE